MLGNTKQLLYMYCYSGKMIYNKIKYNKNTHNKP